MLIRTPLSWAWQMLRGVIGAAFGGAWRVLLKALGALRGVLGALRSVLLAVRMRRRDAFEEYPDAIEDEDEDEDDIFEDIEDVEQFEYPSETHRCGVCYAQILLWHNCWVCAACFNDSFVEIDR